MNIQLNNIGKKFNRDWIFRNIDYTFSQNEMYAIIGSNGSGKSTLLQIILGFIQATEGHITNSTNQEHYFAQATIAAPYIELIEEMTATEFLNFHSKFKLFNNEVKISEILEQVQLSTAADKQIRFFSSGMKQRLKLAQAFFSNSSILLLDEPCSNLDKQGIELYHQLIQQYTANRLVIICSNDEQEYSFCTNILNLSNFKNN